MARRPPEKRIWNIKLYINHCILFKSFKSETTPKETYSYSLDDDREFNKECNTSFDKDTSINLIFGNSWYNEAIDTFEYYLISLD